jgi:hypothetical protein
LEFTNWKILKASGLELTEFGANFNFSEWQIVLWIVLPQHND